LSPGASLLRLTLPPLDNDTAMIVSLIYVVVVICSLEHSRT
jgi:hypothetical protein